MVATAEKLKSAVRDTLGTLPSDIFLARINRTIDAGLADKESLMLAAFRVEKMVRLFLGIKEADMVKCLCEEILKNFESPPQV
jgi:hypothetical protein